MLGISLSLSGSDQGNVSAFDPASLPGPVGLWKMDEGSGNYVYNDVYSRPGTPPVNKLAAPEQLCFTVWSRSGPTVTDLFAASPNGDTTASRIQFSGASQYCMCGPASNATLAAGQYTLSLYAMRNGASDQTFRLSYNDGSSHQSADQTATSAWQRFTYTFTSSAAVTLAGVFSNSGGTAADILIWGAQLESGASATPYRAQQGDFILSTTAPTWGATGLTFTAAKTAFATWQTPLSQFTAVTAYALAKMTSDNGYDFLVTDQASYQNFSLALGGVGNTSGSQGLNFGLRNLGAGGQLDSSWHVLAATYDGSTISYYIDGTLINTVAQAGRTWTPAPLVLGSTAGLGLVGTQGALAVYSQCHSAAQVRQMTTYLQALATARGASAVNLGPFICFEGDSITYDSRLDAGFGPKSMVGIGSSVQWGLYAVAGSGITDLSSRAAAADGRLTPAKTTPVYWCLIGANDLNNAATWVASLKTFLQARQAAGWKVCLATVLPRTAVGFNALRATANASILADPTFYDAIASFGSEQTVGTDAAASDTDYYSDGTHPTALGHAYLAATCEPALRQILYGTTQLPAVTDLGATPGTGQVSLTWSATTGAASYDVYYRLKSATGLSLFGNVGSPGATVTGLTGGSPYRFTVRAKSTNPSYSPSSPYSNTVAATPS